MKQNAAQNPNFDGFKEGLAVQYGVVMLEFIRILESP
jgi:hypothetical protein